MSSRDLEPCLGMAFLVKRQGLKKSFSFNGI